MRTKNFNPAVQEVKTFLSVKSFKGLHPVIITKAIKLMAQAGLVDDSIGILRNAQASGYKKMNVLHYNAAMTACRNHKRYEASLELFDEMPSFGIKPDRVSCSLAIHCLGRLGSWEKAFRLYESVHETNHDEALLLEIMSCLTRNNQAARSYEIYLSAREKWDTDEPSAKLFTAALIALIEMEDYTTMTAVYEEGIKKFPDDNIIKFNWERGVRKKNGEVITHHNQRASASTNTNFKELLRLASSSGDYRYAVKEATRWMDRRIFSAAGVTSALKVFGNANRGDKVEKLLTRLEEQGFEMNMHHQNACMAAFIRCKQPEKALTIFDTIAAPDRYSYGSALQAWTKLSATGALELFYKIPHSDKVSVHYNTVMSCVGKSGDWRKSLDIYFEMVERGLADDISHRIIISTLETAEQLVLASQVKKDCATNSPGQSVNSDNFESFVVDASGPPEVKVVESIEEQQRLAEDGFLPELSQAGTLLAKLSERPEQGSALVQFLGVAKNLGPVDSILDAMEARMQKGEKNIRFHLCNTYNAAILACGVLGEEAKALSYFRRMRTHDVPRNEATYKALLNLSALMGDENTEEIRKLAVADGIIVY